MRLDRGVAFLKIYIVRHNKKKKLLGHLGIILWLSLGLGLPYRCRRREVVAPKPRTLRRKSSSFNNCILVSASLCVLSSAYNCRQLELDETTVFTYLLTVIFISLFFILLR